MSKENNKAQTAKALRGSLRPDILGLSTADKLNLLIIKCEDIQSRLKELEGKPKKKSFVSNIIGA